MKTDALTTKVMKFTPYFQWVSCENSSYRMGITNYAQQVLGEIVYLELPQPGDKVEKDQPCGFVESKKSVVDILSPFSGRVAIANRQLINNPALINQSPYDKGWLFTLETDDLLTWQELLETEPQLEQEGTSDDNQR